MVKVTGSSSFETHPAGPYSGVCCDVIDLGFKVTKYGVKDHVRLVWQTEHTVKNGDGEDVPAIVMSTTTKTIGKDSNLRKMLESWRGKPFTDEEIKGGFDVDSLIGVPCALNIVHRQTADKTYANVASVMRLMKGVTPLPLDTQAYVRVKDRSPEDQAAYLARFRGDDAAPHAAKPGATGGKRRPVEEILADEDDDLPF